MPRTLKQAPRYRIIEASALAVGDDVKTHTSTAAVPISLIENVTKKRSRSKSNRVVQPVAHVPANAPASTSIPLMPAGEDLAAADVISLLQLQPHPEGGFYRRT